MANLPLECTLFPVHAVNGSLSYTEILLLPKALNVSLTILTIFLVYLKYFTSSANLSSIKLCEDRGINPLFAHGDKSGP